MDIEKYIAQLRADVYGWVRSIVPSVSAIGENVDPVARAQIFEQSIRGEVSGRLNSIGMQLVKVGAGPLFLPPYTGPFQSMLSTARLDSREALGQAAKFQGLASFAQSDDQTGFINQAIATSETLGYLSNIIKIYVDSKERSYSLIAKNFESAAVALEKDKPRVGAALRMKGLAALSMSASLLIKGDLVESEGRLGEAGTSLSNSLNEIMRQPATISWYPAVKTERSLVDSMKSILESVRSAKAFSNNHMESLSRFAGYVRGFETARLSSGRTLGIGDRLEPETFRDLSSFFREVSTAKTGSPVVNGLGSGRITIGCWLADLNYSFETGMFFMKKGQGVQERMLVSGTFPIHPHYILGSPHSLVTDIFAVRSQSSFSDRIMGKETTLTTGIGYNSLTPRKRGLPLTGPVVPPLSTKAEAEKMANIYLEIVRQRLQGKLRIGIPSVNQTVYVSGTINNGWLEIPGLPQWMFPYVGDEKMIGAFSV